MGGDIEITNSSFISNNASTQSKNIYGKEITSLEIA